MGEHGVYTAQQQLELAAERTLTDKALHATLALLDLGFRGYSSRCGKCESRDARMLKTSD